MPFCETACSLANPQLYPLSLLVKTDGSILPCQGLYSDEFILGNIHNFDHNEFLKLLQYLTEQAKCRQTSDFGCAKCLIKELCQRGCLASAYAYSGNVLGFDGECEYRLRQYLKYILR